MGEIAEMMLDGTLCELCGAYLDTEGDGVPRKCNQCQSIVDKEEEVNDYQG